MVVLIDNGHGSDTPGKFSPLLPSDMEYNDIYTENGRLMEYKYARIVAGDVVTILKETYGIDARILVPEKTDISLADRVKRINKVCDTYGAGNVLMVSIHCNAASNGVWANARGWEAYTTRGATKSDKLAECLYNRAEKNFVDKKIRTDNSDGDKDKEANFYIIKNAKCVAVLTENFYMDNKEDVKYMLSDEGVQAIVRTHVEGILDYIESIKKK